MLFEQPAAATTGHELSQQVKSGEVITQQEFLNMKIESCDLSGGLFAQSRFINCQFLNSNLDEAVFNDCEFINSRFIGISAKDTNMIKCTLCASHWGSTRLSSASFIECNLGQSKFNEVFMEGMMMGSSRHIKGSVKVMTGGMPATVMLGMAMQNLTNAPTGMTIAPSQTKVLIMS